jgi:Protein of unknown function (DUF3667)
MEFRDRAVSDSAQTHCRNCGQRLNPWDKFCSQCGQDTLDHPPSFWEFVHEWSLHYVAAEGKLWKSLWALIAKPGFLTVEYLAGRKQRYVLPLRLLLTFGLVFFLALKFGPAPVEVEQTVAPSPAQVQQIEQAQRDLDAAGLPPEAASAIKRAMARKAVPAPLVLDPEDREQLPAWLRGPLERAEKRFADNREAAWVHFKSTMLSLAPYAVLLSLPLFAGLLKLIYPGTVYGAHFLFAMHLHAAWYLMLLLLVLLASLPGALLALWLWSNLYPLLALKRVNGTGWWATLWRSALLAMLHWCVIILAVLALTLVGMVSV